MPFIKIITPREADEKLYDVYKYASNVAGINMVAKIVQIFSLRPASMKRMVRMWELLMWMGTVPRHNRELTAAAVSRFNNCPY